MHIKYGISYLKSEKNLKRHYQEQEMLEKIKNHIKLSTNCTELINNPISLMYGLERLKYKLHDLYSFNLNKNGGKIRLICSILDKENTVVLEYISSDHYKDFKKGVLK